jgi:hypothetical protein
VAQPQGEADDGTATALDQEITLNKRILTALPLVVFALLRLGDARASSTNSDSAPTMTLTKAHSVVVSNLKPNDDGTGSMTALLTFGDGSKAECAYQVRWQIETFGPSNGIRYQPVSEHCRPA